MPLKGARQISENLKKIPKKMRGRTLDDAVREAAKLVAERAQIEAPVDTGRLRNSIIWRKYSRGSTPENSIYNVSYSGRRDDPNGAWYGEFVEKGTGKMSAQPFLRPAFDAEVKNAEDIIINRLRVALKLKGIT